MAKPRILSEFICRELLFDYVSDELDPERKDAVARSLSEYPELQEQVEHLKTARQYCHSLKEIQLSEPLFEYFEDRPGVLEKLSINWREVPTPLKWGAQGVIVALALTVGLNLLPRFGKNDVKNNKLVLVEVSAKPTPIPSEGEVPKVAAINPTSANAPSTVAGGKVGAPPQGQQAVGGSDADEVSVPVTPVPSKNPAVVATAKTPPKIAPAKASNTETEGEPSENSAENESGATEKSESDTSKPAGKKGTGVVYRLFMNSDQVDAVTPEVTEKIMALGGEKAGEVELGWKRRSGSYYHFAMPESNYESLVAYLRSHGPVRINKTPHKRVMPAGQIRIILWLEYNQGKKGVHETPPGAD